MNSAVTRRRTFRPSSAYLILVGVMVAPWWWGSWASLISLVVAATAIALALFRRGE